MIGSFELEMWEAVLTAIKVRNYRAQEKCGHHFEFLEKSNLRTCRSRSILHFLDRHTDIWSLQRRRQIINDGVQQRL